jgi:sigma-B regulation protein RsbU (phosphoserine phosphatase)
MSPPEVAGDARRVVLADDDALCRELVATLLRAFGYEVIEAATGHEAWERLERSQAGILVTDWMMPDCDGPELCRRVRRDSSHYVYILMLTSQSHRSAVVEGLEAGADDFLHKLPDPEELRAWLKTGERILRLERQLNRRNQRLHEAHDRLREAYGRIESDLAVAARTQQSLLPAPGLVSGVAVAWMFEPSSHVGGDVFNVLPLDDRTLLFFHVDVVGHGVSAALHAFAVHSLLSAAFGGRSDGVRQVDEGWRAPSTAVAEELNERFCEAGDENRYFTMLLGLLDSRSGRGSLIQAGHPSPILLRRAERRAELLGDGGLPIGLIPGASWEPVRFSLAPGDRLVLYSDGISEADRPGEGPFSEARLAAYFVEHADRPLDGIIDRLPEHLRGWRQKAAPDDDLSLLVLERPPGPGEAMLGA